MNKLVSIIIPVYNVEKYLNRCVESVVNQIYKNIEIILVDDGSPDSCGKMCDEWGKKDLRIKVIHKKNGGLSDARNFGLKIATGEYVLFVDSDDWISTSMVKDMVENMEKNNVDMVICQFYLAYANGKKICKYNNIIENQIFDVRQTIKLLLDDKIITNHIWRKLYKRRLLYSNCFPIGMNYEDIYVMPKLIFSCKKIYYTNNPYYYYFQNQNSITNTASYKNSLDHFKAKKHSFEQIIEKFPEMKQEVKIIQEKTILHICNNLIKNENNYKLTKLKLNIFTELRKESKNLNGLDLKFGQMILFKTFKHSFKIFLILCWLKKIYTRKG